MRLRLISMDNFLGKELLNYPIPNEENTIKNLEDNLKKYIDTIQAKHKNQKSETNQKNDLQTFLREAYKYQKIEIEHDNIDLSLWDNSTLKVIIEAKIQSSTHMIEDDNIHKKSLYQALFYYLQQKENGQNGVIHLIITDYLTFYIFNEREFLNLSTKQKIKAEYQKYKNNKQAFYDGMSILEIEQEITACKIDLLDESLDLKLLYKVLDKQHLFKLPLENDANALNRRFYNELLYVMGLKEDKDFALIPNKVENSLLDLTQEIVENKTPSVNIFETALSLNILWLNRILFLKLLESQLKTVRNDEKFTLLDPKTTANSYALYNLFFNVLNKPRDQRSKEDQENYQYIPYLNSSLFVSSSIEEKYDISSISGDRKIKVQSGSILGDKYSGKEMPLLEYLLSFLNCYQYNREKDGIDPHTVIKSSVLGLVFEQLNGYKDGSHFTPAVITMYMCEEVIHRQVVKAFNETFSLECKDMSELERYASQNFYKTEDREKAQKLIDSITILDPSVGSGHFLVSALNELIAIRSRLGLLHNDIKVHIENDELLISYRDGKPFVYQIQENKITGVQKEIQQLIFNTKKHIIENQLFGVDINPNSVNICRLRLWIELLKHSYFTDEKLIDMEALPNLEFKVITANSLIAIPDMALYFNKERQDKFRGEMHRYYNATLEEKETVKKEVLKMIQEVKESSQFTIIQSYNPFDTQVSSPFFDSGLMFGVEKFDICIGNPPYVYNRDIDKTMLAKYKNEFGYNNDLYTYFYIKAFDFIHEKGIMGFITSNTFLTIYSKTELRKFLQSKRLIKIRLVENIFEKAAVEPVILIAEHTQEKSYTFTYADDRTQPASYPENGLTVSIDIFKNAPNQVFFTPNDTNIAIANRYFPIITPLLNTYWGVIENSSNIAKHKALLDTYRSTLKAGDITLLGLITDGGQGLATANNGYFIGVKAGTKDAERTFTQRIKKIAEFNKKYGTSYDISTKTEQEIRALFAELKEKHGRDEFGQGFLYQIVSPEEFANVDKLTQDEKENGIDGTCSFVPYDKGDKDGNRWYMPTVYGINWSKENVNRLKTDPTARWQGYTFFFREGFCWSLINGDKNNNNLKIKLKGHSVNDVGGMALYPIQISLRYLIIVLNSSFINRYTEQFVNFTVNFQMNDMRQVPVVIPTPAQLTTAEAIFDRAKAIKEQQINGTITPSHADKKLAQIQAEVDDFVNGLYGVG